MARIKKEPEERYSITPKVGRIYRSRTDGRRYVCRSVIDEIGAARMVRADDGHAVLISDMGAYKTGTVDWTVGTVVRLVSDKKPDEAEIMEYIV